MASKIKVDQIEGSAGSSITIPSGQTLTITDGLASSTITSGTLADARIPNLNASKITAGTIADARIPDLNASKITAGTIATARLGSGTASSSTFLRGDGTFAEAGGGDFVKIATGTVSNAAYIDLDGTSVWGTAGTYSLHKLVFRNWRQTQSSDIYARQLTNNSLDTSSIYSWNIVGTNSSTSSLFGNNGDSDNSFKFTRDQIRGDNHSANYVNFELTLGNINPGANQNPLMVTGQIAAPNQDGTNRSIGHSIFASTLCNSSDNANRTGMRFFPGGGNYYTTWTTYGIKV